MGDGRGLGGRDTTVARFAVMFSWLVSRLGEVRSSLIPDCVLAAALTISVEFFFPISLALL